ncbi:uncharacterized protein LY89DRAFT_326022 [Mollisia scopiformis]|uniref:Glycosyltransferase family 32 protein n=1 Tax=Mollisia scopiformis TaxID=149040 RepID=A0A132B8S3_MOLSC|nr:uncharacterized protein LY89DRAFT_326022 [Mollisia scopiformis]KUJ08771.1 hypothetical protein LY89DRAFT_326022 [Mollisia scopiformis]
MLAIHQRPLSPSRKPLFLSLLTICCIFLTYKIHTPKTWYTLSPLPPSPPTIPQNLWYKLGPSGLNNQTHQWTQSCITPNPSHTPSFLIDTTAETWIRQTFAHRPEIVEVYTALAIPVLKADMLRYLLLFVEGGIWSDLDVSCDGVPIRDWVPVQYRERADLVAGWEFDVGWGENVVRELATWIIMARPGARHLLVAVDDILHSIKEKSKEFNVEVGALTTGMVGDVVDFTGPRRFTRSVMKSLEVRMGEGVDMGSTSNLEEPRLVGDVLVMPGFAFAARSNRYKEDYVQRTPKLVTHHFAGTWKNEYGGEGG